ncbi:MAG: transporter substrate-binding domain-containing protein [Methanomicrobiales archaeon]|nr:transporter substrate-binding domain-containing protein [Methanomicrobiales archaeon]
MSLPRRCRHLFLVLMLAGILLLSTGCLAENEKAPAGVDTASLTYYTEQAPPYNYRENGTLKGISVDLLGEITARMGKRVSPDQVHLVPWSEGYQAALTGNNTVLFTTFRLPERETSFKWVGPITTDRHVLFAARDQAIAINGPGDLKGYRIGVVADDAAILQLLEAGVDRHQLVTDTSVPVLINKLAGGEIDLFCYPEMVGRYVVQEATGSPDTFRVVYTMEEVEGYYAFSRDVPDMTVQAFQRALDALKAERDARGISTYERILGRYNPSVGLAQLQYLTEEWAPFNYLENGTPAGIGVEMLDAVFRNLGVNRSRSDIRIVPLSDAFHQAQGNTGTVVFSIVRTPEREPLYQWAGPFTKSSFVVFAPVRRNITIASPADLNRYRIGAVKDSIENTLLTGRGVEVSHIVNDMLPEDLLRKMEGGEIDLWATGDLTGRYEMQKAGVNPDAYEIVYTLSENDFYFIFSRDVPETLVSAFQQALGTVRKQRDPQGITEYERIMYRYLGVSCARKTISDEAVRDLVATTARDIEKNAPETIRHINAGEAPYRDPVNPALYVFVLDTNVTVVAHADNIQVVGFNQRGKTDVTGKPFRDEIVEGALAHGTGWEDYVYSNPVEAGVYRKTAYYQLVRGSDGNSYVVSSGTYKGCE